MTHPVPTEVTAVTMHDYYVHRSTHFTTSEACAAVQVEADEDDSSVVQITIDGQYMTRKDIKELRAFLKCLLADMKSEEA